MRKKIAEIANETVNIFEGKTPFIRFAFVGYTDIKNGESGRHLLDFLNFDRADQFSRFVCFFFVNLFSFNNNGKQQR